MLIIRFVGGYGNQMFNYALAKELISNGINVKADWSFFENQGTTNDFREPIRNHINIDIKEASSLDKRLFWFLSKIKKEKYEVWEDNYGILSLDQIKSMNNKVLIGYYQAEEMFHNVSEEVINHFLCEIKNTLNSYSKEVENSINASKIPVAIHVRGGDYLNSSNIETLGNICGEKYYRDAIEKLDLDVSDATFYVFTNDVEYAKKVLPQGLNCSFITNSESDGLMDIYLMSLCKKIIIANSTFSWWGAYLCKDKEKQVIAPKEWKKGSDRERIYCKDWILV